MKTVVRLSLQGRSQSFSDYEDSLNEQIAALEIEFPQCDLIVLPFAAHDGRICCVINIHCLKIVNSCSNK